MRQIDASYVTEIYTLLSTCPTGRWKLRFRSKLRACGSDTRDGVILRIIDPLNISLLIGYTNVHRRLGPRCSCCNSITSCGASSGGSSLRSHHLHEHLAQVICIPTRLGHAADFGTVDVEEASLSATDWRCGRKLTWGKG